MTELGTQKQNDTEAATFSRRRRWVRPDIQLKIAFRTSFVVILALVLQFQLALVGYWLLRQKVPSSAAAMEQMPGVLLQYFLIALGLAVPLGVAVSIYSSFTFCGPIYRFGQYLASFVDGRWNRRCSIRELDDLQDFNLTLNRAIGAMNDFAVSQQQVLEEARAVIEDAGQTSLLERVDAVREEFDRRFPIENAPNEDSEKNTPSEVVESAQGEEQSNEEPVQV